MREKKSPKHSQIEMHHIVMPHHTNYLGTIFGGTVMSWIDIAAAMCAGKHSQGSVVTAHIDEIDFYWPIKLGDHVCLKANINYVGNTSMEVGVRVERENIHTKEKQKATRAYLTFVAIDQKGKKKQVPELLLESEEDQRRYHNALERLEHRKILKEKLKD